MRELIVSDHPHVREQFVERFSAEIDAITTALTEAYAAYRRLDAKMHPGYRTAYVLAFGHLALNSLITSTNLLLSGLLLPSGNLMRQYCEASAMTLLCSHPKIDAFERVKSNPKSYAYQNAVDYVNRKRNRKLLGLDGTASTYLSKLSKFYHQLSHASHFGLLSHIMFERSGMLMLLGEFDAGKIESYQKELRGRRTAAAVLSDLFDHLAQQLPSEEKSA